MGGEGALRSWSEAASMEVSELENAAEAPAGRSMEFIMAAVTPVRASVAASPPRRKNIAIFVTLPMALGEGVGVSR